MNYNRNLHISMGNSRKSTSWQQTSMMWQDFVERLQNPVRGKETQAEYKALPKNRQDELKDVGGFVGGSLLGGRRKANYVTGRDLIALDMDNIPTGRTSDILKRIGSLGCACVVYSTRKHNEYAPRLRVIIPLDSTATPDEYEPIARRLAEQIGMDFCDPTTFDVARLMYWPSVSSDGVYIYEVYDNPFCSKSGILSTYADWTDVTTWPQVPGKEVSFRKQLAKQEDPLIKKGIVGAFCRTYTIEEAMEQFLPGIYEPTAQSGRYTYTGGSTVGGAVVYDDKFLYSHHATDPCSGQLVNAWDLVRNHKYAELDGEVKESTPTHKLPSFTAMKKFALELDAVEADLAQSRMAPSARDAFNTPTPQAVGTETNPIPVVGGADESNWRKMLQLDGNGNYKKTIDNVVVILENDPLIKGKIATDDFAGCGIVLGSLPWNPSEERRPWNDIDDARLWWYLEAYYGITGDNKIEKGLAIVGGENVINDVKDYLDSLQWDGVKRIETLLPDYLGSEDNKYIRTIMRKSLCGAVARVLEPGCKWDYMPIFTGPQGIGKSTFLNILGKNWFSDSLTSFEGKDAAEMLRGVWINEIGELTALNKQETNAVKQFLTKREDIYRAPYGRRTEKHPRRGVFFGTSNHQEFLKDETGNRRFWPVDVGLYPAKKSVWKELPKEVDQIWAEARAYYLLGEELYLDKELEAMAIEAQKSHTEQSGKEGLVAGFLEKKIPRDWYKMSKFQQVQFLAGNLQVAEESLVGRDRVCAVEIYELCFGGFIKNMKRQDTKEINAILGSLEGWKKDNTPHRYGQYAMQRGFFRM